jgi:hypothetical protein
MRIKIIDAVDSRFTLAPDTQATLFEQLTSAAFCQQVCQTAGVGAVEFTEQLFQPVPYTISTPKGMPAEFEPCHESPDYVIINVPPPFMFRAKIFQPSRLCAVYRKLSE